MLTCSKECKQTLLLSFPHLALGYLCGINEFKVTYEGCALMIKSLNLADLLLYVVEKDNMHLNDPFCIFTK